MKCLVSNEGLTCDCRDTGTAEDVAPEVKMIPLKNNGGPVDLRVFPDHSVAEIFVNETLCMSTRVYPDSEDQQGISIEGVQGSVFLKKAYVYNYRPA